MKIFKKRILPILGILALLYFILMIPDARVKAATGVPGKNDFSWKQDSLWLSLEKNFRAAALMQPAQLDSAILIMQDKLDQDLDSLAIPDLTAEDSALPRLRDHFFTISSLVAVDRKYFSWYNEYYSKVRNCIKSASVHWDMHTVTNRDAVYAMLYGMRAATEEVLLQYTDGSVQPVTLVKDEFSATPAARILGMEVHSGDLLVSRGGAEVSALISRGNDYPGNFSHVALVYVKDNGNAYLIEAHIEKGVAVSLIEQYENDKKLRCMVLRPRYDLPLLAADPLLPHHAAEFMYHESLKRHIPYDFKMNFNDSTAMFCSEVGSFAYRKNNLQLWGAPSTISSQGVVNWLHEFGVDHFVTQMPSDLEYDPQLSVVCEYRDPQTLFKDHLDNAVIDAMLENAGKGMELTYNSWMLPVARVIKAYSVIRNYFGAIGKIPEGMSATKALKNQDFVAMHVEVKRATQKLADEFVNTQHYRPPYWKLVSFARQSAGTMK